MVTYTGVYNAVTDIILYQWLSFPEYLHKRSKYMHIKVIGIETTSSC